MPDCTDVGTGAGTPRVKRPQREQIEFRACCWNDLLPADHQDLLAAKMNLASTRGKLGDLEGALQLVEHVHAAWERLLPAHSLG